MRFIQSTCIVGFFVLFLSACGEKQHTDVEGCQLFDLSQFKDIDLAEAGDLITDDPDILGIPGRIFAVNDSIIALCHTRGNIQVSLLNLNSGQHQVAIKKGEGPNEMLGVSSVSADEEGNLWLSGLLDKKIMTAKWDQSGKDASIEFKYRTQEELLRGITDGRGGIIGLPATQRSVRILKTDSAGYSIDSLGVFPNSTLPDSISPNNFMFQADIAYSPTADKLAVANRLLNKIEIYDVSSGDHSILKYPLDKEIEIKRIDYDMGYSYEPQPLWFTFADAYAGDKNFTVGFKGVEVKSDEDFERGIKKVLEFNWDGKPQRSFSFGDEIVTYAIDFNNNILYTIENRPEPTLVKYQL